MDETSLPTGKRLGSRISLISAVASIPAVAIVVTYAHVLLDFDATDWTQFASALALLGAVAAIYSDFWRRRGLDPLCRWLDGRESGDVSEELTLDAFAAAVSFPADFQRMSAFSWLFAAVGIPVALTLWGGAGWGAGTRTLVMIVSGVTGAMIATMVVLFATKRELEPVRIVLAAEIEDPDLRAARIKRVSIARKLTMAIVGSVLTLLIFAMMLSYTGAGKSIDSVALDWEARALEALAPLVEGGSLDEGGSLVEGVSLDEAVRATFPNEQLLPYPARFAFLDLETIEDGEGDDLSTREEIVAAVEAGESEGGTLRVHQSAVWAWRELSDGRVLTVSIPREATRGGFTGLAISLGVVLVMSLGVAWLVAAMIAGDMRRSTDLLRAAAERMALGDLRRGRILESEDELGDLWRSFERMGSALRQTVRSLSVAADRVDVAASEMASVADGVAGASADQVRRIQQANELMVSINNQVMQVSNSAQALNVSVEESSSSILELGAAGDELNETASILGSKVDEVSSSIEQMVRSVKQVGASSDGLAEAAAETSASMEEMASAMRAVDTTAAMTADLSRKVVGSAESGQDKVSQTINGMQAIRDATDSAESVIRGLGARAKEIGAILDVIDDVADETNLLALNAAIIAAQAGEHGRAFSVVADEIKELADRVLASTKEIGGLIRSVQDESENAIGAIEEGSKSVASGVELSAEAGLSLEEITRSSRESGQHIGEIVSAVREQTKAASHVVSLMDKVRGGVEQIAAASTEQDRGNEVVYRSSVTMREVAQQVRRTTEEQSRGFGRIRESVEGVRGAVENINRSLQEQSSACSQVAEFLEQVSERTRSNEDGAQQMGESIRSLASQAEALREDVAKFQI